MNNACPCMIMFTLRLAAGLLVMGLLLRVFGRFLVEEYTE